MYICCAVTICIDSTRCLKGIINAVVWFAILGLFAPTFALNCLAAIRRRMLD